MGGRDENRQGKEKKEQSESGIEVEDESDITVFFVYIKNNFFLYVLFFCS